MHFYLISSNESDEEQDTLVTRPLVWRAEEVSTFFHGLDLGRNACLGMKIIKYLDNDQLNHPQTSDGCVYAHNHDAPTVPVLSADQLLKKVPRDFVDGVGKLLGEYHMELDERVKPVQHPPRRVPVAIHERLLQALEDLESQEIIAYATTPTPWISSMVVVPKPNGTLHICLDPKDLNRALQRENYP